MSREIESPEDLSSRALQRHLDAGDESSLAEAYEFGRTALADGIGVLDMALILWRTILEARPRGGVDRRFTSRVEAFLLESLSPFEMAHRGAREANEALRKLDERREDHVRRVARELHDQAGQLLATVHFSLDGLREHLNPGGQERLARVAELLVQAEDEIRRVAHELRPSVLDDLGLIPALRFLGEGVTKRSGVSVRVTGSTQGRLAARIESELYRSVQEALSNVARHSQASHALIEVKRGGRELRCRVRDDGRGFDPANRASTEAPGLGLMSIRERLAPLGGAMEVRSQPGAGTELMIRIPLEVAHADTSIAGG